LLTNVGFLGYLASSAGFFILAILLVISWRGRAEGGMLLAAVLIQTTWSGLLSYNSYAISFSSSALFLFEVIRSFFWLYFVLSILNAGTSRVISNYAYIALYLLTSTAVLLALFGNALVENIASEYNLHLLALILLIYAIIGFVLIEQLYRNVQPEKRWAIKFLCIGLGALFAYDLYIYANALLFDQVDQSLWDARGVVNTLIIPLIAISAKRNPNWSFDIFVSRHVVFYSTGIMAVGFYLVLMSFGGYYIKIYGGTWGAVAQTIFFVGAVIVLFVVLSSGKTRAKLKIFISKHFYKNKYDYREEWLRLIHNISEYKSATYFKDQIIQTVAGIVQSHGGALFLECTDGFRCESSWNCPQLEHEVPFQSSLVKFIHKFEWIIDIKEYKSNKEHYANLDIPDWILGMQSAWLIVPLKHNYKIIGFFLLLESNINQYLNWEDRDLLKAVGRQVSSYLAFIQTSEALSQAEQFDAFNRLSAYVVHDLKNQLSQLELVVKNAEQYKNNPDFIADAFLTVSNVVSKMQKMLGQLKKMHLTRSDARLVDLEKILDDVIKRRSAQIPKPKLSVIDKGLQIYIEVERLENALEHLIQNAQEAVEKSGTVEIQLSESDGYAIITVKDDGVGMTQSFIKQHLFKPFYTTKGNAGMGIGVYEVKEFVHAYNGVLNVESAPGQGSVFTIKLPIGVAE